MPTLVAPGPPLGQDFERNLQSLQSLGLDYAWADPKTHQDLTRQTLPAVATGTALVTTDRLGLARGFGATVGVGTTDKVTTKYTANSVLRSYSCWVYTRGTGGNTTGRLFDKRNTGAATNVEAISIFSGSTTTLNYLRGWTTSASALASWTWTTPATAWFHLCLVYDGSSTSNTPVVYINGAPVAVTTQVAASGVLVTNTAEFVIGNRGDDNARNWDGYIKGLRIYNRLLSAQEAARLFNPQTRWEILRPVKLPLKVRAPLPNSGSITIGHPTLAGSGTVTNPSSATGSGGVSIGHPTLSSGGTAEQLPVGAWSWFSNPRAFRVGQYSAIGRVTPGSVIGIDIWDHTAGAWLTPVSLKTVEFDDHDDPSFLRRLSDNKLMCWYGGHNGGSIFQRVSSNADDPRTWAAETSLDAQLGLVTYTYSNPIQLDAEANDPIYLFFRGDAGAGWSQYVAKSTDNGVTWGTPVRWLENGSNRPYLQVVRNGIDRWDFCTTDGHPDETATSIYHGYYQGGNLFKSDGTLVGALATGLYAPSAFTKIYDGATVRGWVWDIAINGSGRPVVVYDTIQPTAVGTDHRYRYAVWTGSAWVDNQVCTAGTFIGVAPVQAETYYGGGITIDPLDTRVVYASRDTGDGTHQLWQGLTHNSGANWTLTQLTSGGAKRLRPYVVRGAVDQLNLAYFTGRYATYTDYDSAIRLLQTPVIGGAIPGRRSGLGGQFGNRRRPQ